MDNKEYTKNALLTMNGNSEAISDRLNQDNMEHILHAALGVTTEAGEIADQVKKHVYYGKKLDRDNLIEESGDLAWYLVVLLQALNSSLDEALEKNIKKLKLRYGNSFSEEKAINRDVKAERKILEEKENVQ